MIKVLKKRGYILEVLLYYVILKVCQIQIF